jgi:hypothetical protein
MEIIEHQFKKENFFIPKWGIKHLFIGTFNPSGGEGVNYYYGRERNKTWELLSVIFKEELDPKTSDFSIKLKKHGIACMDLIDTVKADKNQISKILGEGYKDSEIINNSVKREYNTKQILNVINSNPSIKVYSTWGKGSILKEWVDEVDKIENIIRLVSPSMAAKVPKGNKKFEYMIEDWTQKIT